MEQLIVIQRCKKLCAFYKTHMFITFFTTAHNFCLSWAKWIESMTSHPIPLKSTLILSLYLSSKWYLSFAFPYRTTVCGSVAGKFTVPNILKYTWALSGPRSAVTSRPAGNVLVSVVLPAEEGRGPREVADPNFVPSSFETCGSAGLLAWKSAALADLGSFRNALIKQKQDYRQRREDISRIEVRLSTVLTHTHSHTHTRTRAHTHTHTHTHTLTLTHTHTHIFTPLAHSSMHQPGM